MFLPTTKEEFDKLKWPRADIILVTGDSYIDSPFIGVALIGKVLLKAGYRVGIIAQPDRNSGKDITRLGEPELFWGVTGGSVDSLVANYTPLRKKRKNDDFTPGGVNDKRPDRAVIVYSNLIRQHFKKTVPIVLGGIEASLRRIAHYDFWSNAVRRSILFDAKADALVFGMGEKTILSLASQLKAGGGLGGIAGTCVISNEKPEGFQELPSFEKAAKDKNDFTRMFKLFYENNDPITASGLCQKHGNRYLVQNKPAPYCTGEELDAIYGMEFERAQHPFYENFGPARALETIRFSMTSHRGCYGECNFCAIAVHQGRRVRSRSDESIIKEAETIASMPDFKGYITDVGGPSANMYEIECRTKIKKGSCKNKRCIHPSICPSLKPDHGRQIALLKKLRRIPGVKKVFIASGIRYDLLAADKKHGKSYMNELVKYHVSGQLKIAPEHSEINVLELMGKPGVKSLLNFKDWFYLATKNQPNKQFLTYYIIAAHPGCRKNDMQRLKSFFLKNMRILPEQVQIFTPTPSTFSTLMYYTGKDPFSGGPVFVEKSPKGKEAQKKIITRGKR